MKKPIQLTLVAGLLLWGAPQCLHAGPFTYIPDATDSCGGGGAGGGGGGGGGGGRGGGGGGSRGPDPVTFAMPKAALAGGTGPVSCGAVCGGGSGGGNDSGSTGGGGASCCSGGDDDNSGPDVSSIWAGDDTSLSALNSANPVPGMPVWDVSEPYINLWLYDEPLGYQPGLGPRLSFKLAYKQRAAPLVASNIYSVGTNWTCFWLSYVEDDWSASQAILTLRSGGQIIYSPPDGSTIEYYTHTTLLRQPSSGYLTGFVRTFPSGAADYYQSIPAHVSLPDGNTPAFLTARVDPSGHTNVVFAYSETQVGGNWVFRLTSVTDADGRVCTVSYTNSNPTLITGVADPFGRSAVLRFDGSGRLTNVTDTAGLSSSFLYDSQNWITNLTTPYGTTTFVHVDNNFVQDPLRACQVIDAAGGTNLYMLRGYSQQMYLVHLPVPTNPPNALFDDGYTIYRESYHWGPRQAAGLPSDMTTFTDTDYVKSRMRHWLHLGSDCSNDAGIGQSLSLQLDPSPDGVNPGQATWYTYDGMNCRYHDGTNSLPAVAARVLPDGTTWYTTYERDVWGRATNVTDTYSTNYSATPLTRTRQSVYSGSDLVTVIGPLGETLAGYAYTNHLPLRATNAVGDVTAYTWDSHSRLTSVKTAAGLTHTNLYFASGAYTNFVQTAIDLEINRTNSFTYTNDLVYTHTDERGLTTTDLYDSLNRLTNSANPLGAISYLYNKLDLVQVKDRLGFTTSFFYDAVRRRTAVTNALGRATLYNYCDCGALSSIEDAAGNYTYFTNDLAGRLTQVTYPDGYTVNYYYDLLGELVISADSAGVCTTNWFNNQGQLYEVDDAGGVRSASAFDAEDRVTNRWDANGLGIGMTYDNLGRLLSRWYPDGGTEDFTYSARGLAAYTNQLGYVTLYGYDPAARKIAETNANHEVILYTNNAAGDLLTLTDGKNQTTTWHYDAYGRVTNKLDQIGSVILTYAYDGDNRLTNRWSAAKGNTAYAYDPVGNLTNVAYPTSGTVKFAYDVMNRLTNMVDGVGTNRYTYDAAGQLLTEGGVFTSDTITNTHSSRERVALSLQQPTGSWTNGFGWDLAGRLTNVTSKAGAFSYTYAPLSAYFSGRLVQELGLPNGAYITNYYDPVARVLDTLLKSSGGTTLDSALYGYNQGNQRTAYTNAVGAYVHYTYDSIGQLKVGTSSTSSENRGYTYDTAWNLQWLTNNGTASAYQVNVDNELTNVASRGLKYDANGNLTNKVTDSGGDYNTYIYDDENRLVDVQNLSIAWETVFVYDGLGRLRIRKDYAGAAQMRPLIPTGGMPLVNQVNYLYDGWRVVQERDSNNVPTVSYTRGVDLSGSLEGAGGIGGLLARSSGYSSGNWTSHAYYHADGNGNVTSLIATNQSVVASYRYDPFGNTLSQSGTLATANVYRFSSKEILTNALMYYYGYRFYDPSVQRWINRDPIQESGGINVYAFVANGTVNTADILGLGPIGLPGWGIPGRGNPQCTAKQACEKRGGHYGSLAGNKYGGDMSACMRACVANSPGLGLITWPLGGGIGTGIGILFPITGGVLGGLIGAGGPYAICARGCSEPRCSLDQSPY